MATNYFKQRLDQALDFSAIKADPFSKTYNDLAEIADSIEKKLNEGRSGDPIKVEIEPGFQADIGQQLRLNIRIPNKGFRDTLFRAYVPDAGVPVALDLFGEEPEMCDTSEEMQNRILTFLGRIKDRMAAYRDYAMR